MHIYEKIQSVLFFITAFLQIMFFFLVIPFAWYARTADKCDATSSDLVAVFFYLLTTIIFLSVYDITTHAYSLKSFKKWSFELVLSCVCMLVTKMIDSVLHQYMLALFVSLHIIVQHQGLLTIPIFGYIWMLGPCLPVFSHPLCAPQPGVYLMMFFLVYCLLPMIRKISVYLV